MRRMRGLLGVLLLCAVLGGAFTLLFYTDNKYQTPPPYGRDGVICLDEEDLQQGRPIFLIDGWLLSDARTQERPTWIGEFSDLQRGELQVPPHGDASYALTLRYTGATRMVAVDVQELWSDYIIRLDDTVLAAGQGSGQVIFPLTQGDQRLTVETSSHMGYYSGMYYPPALGTPEVLAAVTAVRTVAYALALFVPLALALFMVLMWRTGGELGRLFTLLCCCFSLYVSWYFIQLFRLSWMTWWSLVENIALYGLCFCVVQLTALVAAPETARARHRTGIVMLALPVVLLLLYLMIPVFPWAVAVHGALTDLYYLLTGCFAAYFALRGGAGGGWEVRWTRWGCVTFGLGLGCNLLLSNRFEPIRFFWQFEWCGLLLVVLFGAMMAARGRRILAENQQLTGQLERTVEQRTEQLVQLLEERKAFFSDMAHDLKAPVFATQAFIAAIRDSGVGVDEELDRYLHLAQVKQTEMARRLQGLSALNALDKIQGERERISVGALLRETAAIHRGETEVAAVHLVVIEPETDGWILAQREKLELLFENLIFNALRATPPEGRITLEAHCHQRRATILISDTGCGIPEEELPRIFQRFFVGARDRSTGTGLGLYIARSIVEELGGTICAASTLEVGTTFQIQIPLVSP